MGEIFLAKHGLEGFEKLCVIKKVLSQLSADQHFISRFVDEAQVAIHLQHANVAQVFEVGCVGKEYFIALEFIEGRDLRRTLARLGKRGRRFPVDMALLVARDLANGLAYAHRRTNADGEPLDLVHCDISPPNVVVSFEGEVKIIDFGIAKSAMRITVTDPKMGFGKFGYMSPEQLVRGAKVDHRTDIYAAGAVLFEMLTGTRLHDVGGSRDYRALVKQVLEGKHAKPSDIDPTLLLFDEVVLRAVHVQVKRRFQHAHELRDSIQQLLVQRNPTISSDALGEFMRDVFEDRVHEVRQLAVNARATNLEPWQHEIDDQSASSVSFARAEVAIPAAPNDPAAVPDALAHGYHDSVSERLEVAPRRTASNDDAPTSVWRDPARAARAEAARAHVQSIAPKRRTWLWLAILLFAFTSVAAVALIDCDDQADSVPGQ
jgi:serine/threonine protein kinase